MGRVKSALSRKMSVKSGISKMSAGMEAITSDKGKQTLRDAVKLCFIVLPPLLATGVLAYLQLNSTGAVLSDLDLLKANLEDSKIIRSVVTTLGKERGMVCAFLQSQQNSSSKALERLYEAERDTDKALDMIKVWLNIPGAPKYFSTKEMFKGNLKKWRESVALRNATCAESLQGYSEKVDFLIGKAMDIFQSNDEAPFWLGVIAYHSILMAKDFTGIKRALGGAFFAAGMHSPENHVRFIELGAGSDTLMHIAGGALKESGELWKELQTDSASLQDTLSSLETIIVDNTLGVRDAERGLGWFENVTSHISLVSKVEKMASEFLVDTLSVTQKKASSILTQAMVTVIISAIICPPLTLWYGIQSKNMMAKIRKFAEETQAKSREIAAEKQKSEVLLYQMLPKSVAKSLKVHKPVESEFFTAVSIYFSDVVSFTTLSSKSTPIQIVDLLNALYGSWDATLDQYDCYKVETIGDAYMVVSGLPERNGDKHSSEIATIALHLLLTMVTFEIPHMPGEKLLIRIGCHTGPVCAGVVGAKMPRYCLFGDTVTNGAAMESSGAGQRIHISEVIQQHLELNHPGKFTTIKREDKPEKDTCGYDTYWLLAKEGFPYKVDMEEAAATVAACKYNKLN